MYSIDELKDETIVSADNQDWNEETLKAMNKFGIYLDGSVGVMVSPNNPRCIVLGIEDDGNIFFEKDRFGGYQMEFHKIWIDGLINSLQKVKERLQ